MQTSQTNWAAIDAMADEDIDFSDSPEVTPEQFSKAIVRRNLKPVVVDSVAKETIFLLSTGLPGEESS